jgi:UDP-GlcNAc:undecaprenyl-phosphate/decaprenyl-phosphate GlcNAc-1-phosphate transferase
MLSGFSLYYALLFVGAFVVTYVIMPKIIGVVTFKRLMDHPNERSSHKLQTPSLGGIAFYIVLVLGLYFLRTVDYTDKAMVLVPGLLILFIIGLKDDLVVLSPLTKIFAQVASISFVLIHPDFHIRDLHGFMGIQEISTYVTIPLAAFVMLSIINAFNLIDGIDGLAAIVGIVIFSVLGLLFFLLKLPFFLGISVIMIGSLLAFLRFNLSSNKKIFMGDTGSLLIGFIIACAVIRVFAVPSAQLRSLPFYLDNLPLVVMAILVVPFFDTARVFTIRIMNRRSPFSPDRNHIHHILIDYLKLTHKQASIAIGTVNVIFICLFILLSTSVNNYALLGITLVFLLGLTYVFYRLNFSYKNLRRRLLWRRKMQKLRGVSKLL